MASFEHQHCWGILYQQSQHDLAGLFQGCDALPGDMLSGTGQTELHQCCTAMLSSHPFIGASSVSPICHLAGGQGSIQHKVPPPPGLSILLVIRHPFLYRSDDCGDWSPAEP